MDDQVVQQPLIQTEVIHIAFFGLGPLGFEENGQGLEDCRFAIVIATDDTDYGFVNRNDGSGAVAAEMGELSRLEAHKDFLIYNWPEKAL